MNLTPNQIVAFILAAGSIIIYLVTNKDKAGDTSISSTPEEPKPVKTKKALSAFSLRVKEVIDACPYADWACQKEYLLSGYSVPAINKLEMIRLGEKEKKTLGGAEKDEQK